MDIRKLHSFVKIIDIGSITRASAILHIAQPALSQQVAALESHYGKPLLVRSKRGVVPTEAGKALYRHSQMILRQMEEAELDIQTASEDIRGVVRVGLAPLGLGALLAAQLIKKLRESYPGVMLYVNENVGGGTMSELIMTGKMDVALIFYPGAIPSLSFEKISTEELHFVTISEEFEEDRALLFADVAARPLILPSKVHTLRQVIDTTLARAGMTTQVIAQTESISVLSNAISEGLGDTILPLSAALAVQRRIPEARICPIHKPNMRTNMAVCWSAQLPLSEATVAVQKNLIELARQLTE
ncbi:LysR family transcriptional regulator, nitrogen assimilation regulatory protein [Poseidonocella pacifica]|uniref:LysR family transcriptional regulator, nitrogen assimilation regulatory protein n=1 Tax=Poseidonocella pacifica TaxID=871651 RepID=A0A1I0YB77_9RHOB|nr:LysR substrate-binding domain-containing protein [Poseidonocella pacifica]SFB10554.1 LysR family transcriptional regulator, nitrogen assimilation regulatory protein [Poseidonocella pacifica]